MILWCALMWQRTMLDGRVKAVLQRIQNLVQEAAGVTDWSMVLTSFLISKLNIIKRGKNAFQWLFSDLKMDVRCYSKQL